MERRVKLEKRIGGLDFVIELPRSDTKAEAVQGRYLIAMDRFIMGKLCEYGKPSPDGFQFLRTRSQFKAADLARLIDVAPETISRWENGKNEVPGSAWELLVTLAEEYLHGRTNTRDRLRERHERREQPHTRFSLSEAALAP
jgi:DNA-binding transcriptional regulator YiaG